MNYEEAVSYIENIPRFAITDPLKHAEEMLRRVGEPQNLFETIHVAGTNGKGSVCAYFDAMFREGDFKCGLFTSPHLVKINERFKVNGQDISNEDFLRLFQKVKAVIDDFANESLEPPSYFEIVYVIGMLYFAEQKVDIAIIETGLGGRLDATNAVAKPLACVITAMGHDHSEYLGATLGEIASEKAGIIKYGVPVIYEKTNDEVAAVIEKQAKVMNANTYQLNESMYEIIQKSIAGIDFSLHYKYYKNRIVGINSIASYQMANASLALLAMAVLQEFHHLSADVLCQGIAKTQWPGRMEEVLPGVILDGAHNEEGVLEFIKTVAEFKDKYEITILFAAVSDKKYQEMIRLINSKLKPQTVVTTQVDGGRKISAKHLAECFNDAGCQNVYNHPNVLAAFEQAQKLKGEGLLFCVGSLYMIGEIQKIISDKEEHK